MHRWILTMASLTALAGCTTTSLNMHTLSQARSSEDLRYQEVVNNLAMIAHDPFALPVYSSIFAGTISVTDSGSVGAMTTWNFMKGATAQNGFGSEALSPSLSRTVIQNWTLDPITVPEKLEALRAACQWVVYGPQMATPETISLLSTPEQAPSPGRHFSVLDRLAQLPPGWLRCGRLKDVPPGAAYKAHCGETWVWVCPGCMNALSAFALIFQDIARVDSNSPTLFVIPPSPGPVTFQTPPCVSGDGHLLGVSATVAMVPGLSLAPDLPYYPYRQENTGSDAALRSQISAANPTP